MATAPNPPPSADDRTYPNLEIFLEYRERQDASSLFAETRGQLQGLLEGSKAPAAKKALAAIEKTETLLTQLFDVRDRLLAEKAHTKGKRR